MQPENAHETSTRPARRSTAPWTEVRVDAPEGTEELVAEAMRHHPAAPALTDGPAEPPPPSGTSAVRTYIPAREDDERAREAVRVRLDALAGSTGLEELAGLRPRFRPIPAEDWEASWKSTWRPFRVGHLCIVPPWDERELRDGDVPLRLAPGGVFGTGRHPSTRTCLRELQALPVRGARVLDAGTGTGILAVAAALLGARRVFGFDLDPDSEPAARELARDNAVDERTRFATGGFESLADATTELAGPADGLLANIYHDVHQESAGDLARALRPDGWFVLSGIHVRHREATRRAVDATDLRVERDLRKGNWCTFVGTRAAGHRARAEIRGSD